jgi:class 3 adenylate cyclase
MSAGEDVASYSPVGELALKGFSRPVRTFEVGAPAVQEVPS